MQTQRQYDEVTVVCPFYVGSTGDNIICEGIGEGDVTEHRFHSRNGRPMRDRRNAFKEKYCDCSYLKCPFYKALNERYEGV